MQINPGDYIEIRMTNNFASLFKVVSGRVMSAKNYGTDDDPDWYIELQSQYHGYVYWKQKIDGGQILSH